MVAAIRIDRTEVIRADRGQWHVDLLRAWMTREGLSEDAADAALETGRLEFGHVYWIPGPEGGAYKFLSDEAKTQDYGCVAAVVHNAREGF